MKGSAWIGKCPKTMTRKIAEKLLNEGIPWYNPRKKIGCPTDIYNVHEGVVYRAVPTLPGKSYHGFPEINIPYEIEEKLLKRADKQKCRKELEKWLKEWRRKTKR